MSITEAPSTMEQVIYAALDTVQLRRIFEAAGCELVDAQDTLIEKFAKAVALAIGAPKEPMVAWARASQLAAALRVIMDSDEAESHPCGPKQYGHLGSIARDALASWPNP